MRRIQLSIVFLVLLFGAGVSWAKPKIAILGIEVTDRGPSPQALDAARKITEGLRMHAKSGIGPYELADNSEREFLDEKIINQCEREQADCLQKMAGNFGAQFLMYGKLQTDKKDYQLTVHLLFDNGKTKAMPQVISSAANEADFLAAGKKVYDALVGVAGQGGITVRTQANKGIVYFNGAVRGQLDEGTFATLGLADGEYQVKVVADGYKPWEKTVRVRNNVVVIEPELEAQRQPPNVDLSARPSDGERAVELRSTEGTVSGRSGKTGWKVAAYGGAVLFAAGSALAVQQYFFAARSNFKDKPFVGDRTQHETTFFGCASGEAAVAPAACKNVRNAWIAGTVGVAGAAVSVVGWFMLRSGETKEQVGGTPPKQPRFAVTPIVAPDGGGATVRIDF